MMRRLLTIAASGISFLLASQANAAVFTYDLRGSSTANFTIDTDVNKFAERVNAFEYYRVSGVFQGVTLAAATVVFPTANIGGAFYVNVGSGKEVSLWGTQLYTGSLASPTLSSGTFKLNGGAVTLTVKSTAGAVPEPATWAMMILGMGAVGYAMRRRQKATAKVRFA